MFGITSYSIFLVSSILLNLTPGADTLYIVGNSISNGRRAGVLSALGISTGCLIHTLLAALGLSVILAQSALAFSIVKYLGAAYLIYLGIRTLLRKNSVFQVRQGREENSFKAVYLQGILTNVLNPKVALFFLAFLPQFIEPSQSFGPLPFLLLGLSFILTGTIWCVTIAVLTSVAAERVKAGLGQSGWMNKFAGLIYIGLGIHLLRAKLA